MEDLGRRPKLKPTQAALDGSTALPAFRERSTKAPARGSALSFAWVRSSQHCASDQTRMAETSETGSVATGAVHPSQQSAVACQRETPKQVAEEINNFRG